MTKALVIHNGMRQGATPGCMPAHGGHAGTTHRPIESAFHPERMMRPPNRAARLEAPVMASLLVWW
jgi:hypothetical protein